MSFEPITTQEGFDSAISERLKREREKIESKFADYGELKTKLADYEKQFAEFNKQLETLGAKEKEIESQRATIQKFETDAVKTRLAHEAGLPYGSTKYINGNTEDEIKASIDEFKSFVKTSTPAAPLANPEPIITEAGKNEARNKELLAKLKGEN